MRILFVIPYFYPAWAYGGPVKVSHEIAKYLVKAGHDVTVYTTDAYDGLSRVKEKTNCMVDQDGIKVYYFKNLSNRLAYRCKVFLPKGLIKTFKRECENFDIIHLHEYYTTLNILIAGSSCRKKHKIPYVLSAHGSVFPSKDRGNCIRKHIFNILFGYKILHGASGLTAYTDTEKKQYIDMGCDEKKVEIIPGGIDLSKFSILPDKSEFRNKYHMKGDEKIVLFVGRLHKIKRVDLLLKSFSLLINDINNVKLVIVGPDEGEKGLLEKLCDTLNIREKVLFLGFVTEAEKLQAYAASNLCVLPSINDVYGMSLLDACACARPVVATEGVGLASFVQDYNAGFKVKGDEKDLKNAMFRILADSAVEDKMGKNAKNMVKELFDWDIIMKKIQAFYRKIISECR